MKTGRNYFYIRHIPAIILALLSAAAIIIYPTEFATGAKNGLALLGESVIPALFPLWCFPRIWLITLQPKGYSIYFINFQEKFST